MRVGIAGAGLMGRLLAWQLLRQGHTVELFDADQRDGDVAAARVAAAMLAPYSEAVACEREIFDWGRDAVVRWPQLLAELATDAGPPVWFRHAGSIVVAHRADRATLHHFNAHLRQRAPDALADVRWLDRSELQALEPELSGFSEATFLADEGTLDNHQLLARLAEAIEVRGGIWHPQTPVESVAPGELRLADRTLTFDLAIDTRGLGARQQLPGLRGVRGEVLWVRAPDVQLQRPVRLMHPRYQLYIAPKSDSVYVIGATEIESDSMAPITVRSSLELLSALYSVHSGFAEAEILHSYANCRPAFADNLPRIEVGAGLLRVNGLYRHGYLLGPWALELALAALRGETTHPVVRRI
ncbi:MAG: FAD-dependent oxidoreductase [Spongiibacteraceae bacterium]|jgi:glycine oxidase|nr:FAD-dependent oxidoreductase [Spongiibacteraceae bacterium]